MSADEPVTEEMVQFAGRLFDLARTGATDAVRAYIAAGVSPNLHNDRGDTLLMLAAYHGHAATVRALLDGGADPDRCNDRGQSPLAGAVFRGEDDVVRVLVEGGADPARGAPSAFDTARMFGRDDLLAVLERRRG